MPLDAASAWRADPKTFHEVPMKAIPKIIGTLAVVCFFCILAPAALFAQGKAASAVP
jgi:hypothetical protein